MAGLRVPAGMEMGPFCYFPDWPREQAERCHVLNRELMGELIRTCRAPVASFSGYGLTIRSPEISPLSEAEHAALWALVREHYTPWMAVTPFGQADTKLELLRRAAAAAP